MHLDSWYEKLCQKGSKKMKQQLEENLDQGMCETVYTGAYLYPNRKDITETKIQMMQEKEGITEGVLEGVRGERTGTVLLKQ